MSKESQLEPFPFAEYENNATFQLLRRLFGEENYPHIDESIYPLPNITPEWFPLLRKLVLYDDDEVTVFNGGRLDLGHALGEHWLLPVIAHFGEESVGLQVVLSNIDRFNPNSVDPREAKVNISLATETEIKLLAFKPEEQALFRRLNQGDLQQAILIRPVMLGNLVFPFIKHLDRPNSYPAIRAAIIKFASLFNVGEVARREMPSSLEALYDENREILQELDHFVISKPLKIAYKGDPEKLIFVYNVVAKGDIWRTYQIFAWQPLGELVKLENPKVRFDSACDTGMIFHDQGCDCHQQLLAAIELARQDDGFVIHIPGHEGRGYGMPTKLETELLKQGRRSALYPGNRIVRDTITAARMVFGSQQFDIRTFYAPGKLLQELGFQRVSVITDNRQKMNELSLGANGEVDFQRIPTSTDQHSQFSHLELHLDSKHSNRRYFDE